jgi:HAD superfamily hydrolase (TIGR01490 family)
VTLSPDDPAPSVVAAFDFDGTLTRGGSVWPFLVAIRGRRPVVTAGVVLAGRLALAAAFGGRFADEAKEALFRRTLAGLRADELAGPAAAFGRSHYRRHARADVRARLEWHRTRGHRIVIVSASLDCYLAPLAADLGVGLVATRLAVGPDGRLTGSYDGRNCRGSEKLARVRQWMAETGDTTGAGAITDVLWAYGNSDGDRQLLGAADVGVDVGRLGRFGSLRAFPRLSDIADDDHPGDGAALTRSDGAGGRSSAGSPGRRWRRR